MGDLPGECLGRVQDACVAALFGAGVQDETREWVLSEVGDEDWCLGSKGRGASSKGMNQGAAE